MRSGRLKHLIVIQLKSQDSDAGGEPLDIFTKVFDAKANVKVISGVEIMKAGVAKDTEVISVLMRADTRLLHHHFILHKTNRYEISAIKPSENDREIIVTADRQVI